MVEIQDVICRFAKDPSIISRILIVMSHGNKYELMDTNDICYDYKSVIIDAFNVKNAPHLTNVLKLIMIQACRYIFFKHISSIIWISVKASLLKKLMEEKGTVP